MIHILQIGIFLPKGNQCQFVSKLNLILNSFISAFNPNFLSVIMTQCHDLDKVTGGLNDMGPKVLLEDICPECMDFAFQRLIISLVHDNDMVVI